MRNAFRYNHRSWVAKALALNEVDNVTLIRADASHFDYSAYRDISFALIDVDLYLPVRSALQALFPVMAPGGVIVVDDCLADNMYDGALQAYREFTAAHGLPERITHGKLGVIDVPHR
jgi:predicted O-methyltransferase YrrM